MWVLCRRPGLENEGWIDPWALQNAFKRKAMFLGVTQCFGEVTGVLRPPDTQKYTRGGKRYRHFILQEGI